MTMQANAFNAVGPTIGYLYQCRYGLLLLLERTQKDAAVELCIERFDDISIGFGGSASERHQTLPTLCACPFEAENRLGAALQRLLRSCRIAS